MYEPDVLMDSLWNSQEPRCSPRSPTIREMPTVNRSQQHSQAGIQQGAVERQTRQLSGAFGPVEPRDERHHPLPDIDIERFIVDARWILAPTGIKPVIAAADIEEHNHRCSAGIAGVGYLAIQIAELTSAIIIGRHK